MLNYSMYMLEVLLTFAKAKSTIHKQHEGENCRLFVSSVFWIARKSAGLYLDSSCFGPTPGKEQHSFSVSALTLKW